MSSAKMAAILSRGRWIKRPVKSPKAVIFRGPVETWRRTNKVLCPVSKRKEALEFGVRQQPGESMVSMLSVRLTQIGVSAPDRLPLTTFVLAH